MKEHDMSILVEQGDTDSPQRKGRMPKFPRKSDEAALIVYAWEMLVYVLGAFIGRMGFKAFIGTLLTLAGLFAVGTYFAAPALFSAVFYQSVIIYWPYVLLLILVVVIFAIPVFGFLESMVEGNKRGIAIRGFVLIIAAFAFYMIPWSAVEYVSRYFTYTQLATFEDRDAPLVTHPEKVRYTPRINAFNDIEQSITAPQEVVHFADTVPFISDEGFAFATQITPDDGLVPYNGFFTPNPGFVLYYDNENHTGPRVERVDEEQVYGLRKAWFLDAWWRVYNEDRFSIFEDPHYLRITHEDGSVEHLTVFPQIKHYWWRLPYWAGIAVVNSDGEVTMLSVEEATADPRFARQWIAPMSLMRQYVEDQTMQAGLVQNWFGLRSDGRLTVPDLDGVGDYVNQYPFLTVAADGTPYAYVTTRPVGGGDGLVAMYYLNLATGARSRYVFGTDEIVYGVSAIMARVTSIGGYTWYQESKDSSSGQTLATEPVYIVRPGEPDRIYWKVTVTNIQYRGISAQVVFDATDPNRFRIFDGGDRGRTQFYDWLEASGDDGLASGNLSEQIRYHLEQIQFHQAAAADLAEQLEGD